MQLVIYYMVVIDTDLPFSIYTVLNPTTTDRTIAKLTGLLRQY